jgi:hypothetical protein
MVFRAPFTGEGDGPTDFASEERTTDVHHQSVGVSPEYTTGRLTRAKIDHATSGDNTIISAPGAGLRIRIYGLLLKPGVVNVKLKDSTPTDLTGAMVFASGDGTLVLPISPEPYFELAAATAFVINLSGAVNVSGAVWYKVAA